MSSPRMWIKEVEEDIANWSNKWVTIGGKLPRKCPKWATAQKKLGPVKACSLVYCFFKHNDQHFFTFYENNYYI